MNIDDILSGDDLSDMVIEIFDDLLQRTSDGTQLDSLKPAARTFYLVQNFDTYMNNDGFVEFFVATSPDQLRDTLRALEAIGADKMKGILEKAIAVWPAAIPGNSDEREDVLLNNLGTWTKNFEKLNNDYLVYPDEIEVLQINYVEKFKSDFE